MRRREFIPLIAAAIARPMVAHAQQSRPVIGFLHGATREATLHLSAAFQDGLRAAGFAGTNAVSIEFRFANNDARQLTAHARQLVERNVSLIAAMGGDLSARAAMAATSEIPIVFTTGSDPVKAGLVSSLNRPMGNVTGITFLAIELGAKRAQVMRDLLPGAKSLTILGNAAHPDYLTNAIDAETAARSLGFEVAHLAVSNHGEIAAAFQSLAEKRADALLVLSNPLFTSHRAQLVALAAQIRLPTVYPFIEYSHDGGLISYGANRNRAYRDAGVLAGRILQGKKPSELPVEQPTRFELAINLKTAKTFGIEVPPMLLAIADEVIE